LRAIDSEGNFHALAAFSMWKFNKIFLTNHAENEKKNGERI